MSGPAVDYFHAKYLQNKEQGTANVWLRGLISTKTRNPTRGNVKSGGGQTELQAEYLQNKEQGTANVWLRGFISS